MRGTVTYKWQPGNRKGAKYGSKSTVYNQRKYDSKAEATYAEKLDWRLKANDIKEVVPQFTLGIYIGDSLWRKWRVDFKVVLNDDTIELHEVKGMELPDYQMKRDALLKILDSDCECNYITDYQTGRKLDKTIKLIVIK